MTNNEQQTGSNRQLEMGHGAGESLEDGWLFRFPGELRNRIYVGLISSGSLALMRTNSQVCSEMLWLVDEGRCYRMFINHSKGLGCRSRLPDRSSGERVQNVEVYWRLPDGMNGYLEDGESIAAFDWDIGIRRRQCSVYLERHSYRGTWIRGGDLRAWRKLRVFSEVVFRVVLKGDLAGEGNLGLRDRCVRAPLRTIRGRLELWLGEAEEGSDSDGRLLRFQPGLEAVGDNRDRQLESDMDGTYMV